VLANFKAIFLPFFKRRDKVSIISKIDLREFVFSMMTRHLYVFDWSLIKNKENFINCFLMMKYLYFSQKKLKIIDYKWILDFHHHILCLCWSMNDTLLCPSLPHLYLLWCLLMKIIKLINCITHVMIRDGSAIDLKILQVQVVAISYRFLY